jgi:ATP-dependent DNA helicase RecQ
MHVPVAEPPSRAALLALLRERFGLESFRPGQEAVLKALLAGHDVLTVLPTGAGKSLVFQLASQVLEGVDRGVAADYYHGQRSKGDRARVQDAFIRGEIRVIAATNAFGLGVDKPDFRFVIHRDVPGSLEAYYQEAGRAGRDGDFSRCLLLYRTAELGRAAFLNGGGRLNQDDLGNVCAVLRERGEVTPAQLRKSSGLSQLAMLRIVAALEHEGVVGRRRGKLRILGDGQGCEAISLEAEERQRAYDRSRLDMMRGYAELRGCRHEYVLNYFGEAYDPIDCQMCDNSLERSATRTPSSSGPFAIGDAVHHESWGSGLVERVTPESVTVLFDTVGFKTLDLDLMVERGLLKPAGAAAAHTP